MIALLFNLWLFDIVIQTLGSGILFVNKIYLYKKVYKIGWILGIMGLMIMIPSIHLRQLWTVLIYHFFLSGFMVYALFLLDKKERGIPQQNGKRTQILILGIAFLCCTFLSFQAKHDPNFTGLQLAQAVTGLFGCYFMIYESPASKIAGWSFNFISHMVCAYLMVKKGAYPIAFFQVLSIGFAVAGFIENKKKLSTTIPV